MNKIGRDIIYSIRVWLTSVVVSPFLLSIIVIVQDGYTSNATEDAVGFIFMAMIFGFIFSIPCWIALAVSVRTVYNAEYSERKFKTIINIIAIIIALVIFGVVFGGFYQAEGFSWSIPYIITLSFGIWYFKLAPKEIQVPTTIDHLIE